MGHWGCYLICFDTPYKHARHYIGWSSDIDSRVQNHFDGHGSRLVQVVREAGIECTLTRVWYNKDRFFERSLKNQKNTPRMCPRCNTKLKLKKGNKWKIVTRT